MTKTGWNSVMALWKLIILVACLCGGYHSARNGATCDSVTTCDDGTTCSDNICVCDLTTKYYYANACTDKVAREEICPSETPPSEGRFCLDDRTECVFKLDRSSWAYRCVCIYLNDDGDCVGTPGVVTNLTTPEADYDVTGNFIKIAWDEVNGYGIRYTVVLLDGGITVSSRTASSISVYLYYNSFRNGYTYRVEITAWSHVFGSDGEGDVFSTDIKTAVKVPMAPTDVACDEVMDEYLTLTWTAPTVPNGDLVQYIIKVYSTSPLAYVMEKNTNTPVTQFKVEGLSPDTTYIFRVYTENELYVSTYYSSSSTCVTKAKLPMSPTDVACDEVMAEYLTLTWTAPTVPNGDLVQYIIKVYSASPLAYVMEKNTNTPVTQFKVEGLSPGTAYIFRVYTENELYVSTYYSSSSTCVTKAKLPGRPHNMTVSNVTSRSFTVSWEQPEHIYSDENLGYLLQVRTNIKCVDQVIYVCDGCFQTQIPQPDRLCVDATDIQTIQVEKSTLQTGMMSRTIVDTLLPGKEYAVEVSAINHFGSGSIAYISQKTTQELCGMVVSSTFTAQVVRSGTWIDTYYDVTSATICQYLCLDEEVCSAAILVYHASSNSLSCDLYSDILELRGAAIDGDIHYEKQCVEATATACLELFPDEHAKREFTNYSNGLNVTSQCNDGYIYGDGNYSKIFTCTNGFWDFPENRHCLPAQDSNSYVVNVDLEYKYVGLTASCETIFTNKLTNELPRFESNLQSLCGIGWDVRIVSAKKGPGSLSSMLLANLELSLILTDISTSKSTACVELIRDGNFTVFEFQSPPMSCGVYNGEVNVEAEQSMLVDGEVTCSTNHVKINRREICVPCGPGYYYDNDIGKCASCPAGQYQNQIGHSSCKDCLHGLLPVPDQTACQFVCPGGYFSNDSVYPCEPCVANTFSSSPTTCDPCPNWGSTVGKTAVTSVNDCYDYCPAGSYSSSGYDDVDCIRCPVNFYQPGYASTDCIACPPFTSTFSDGSISLFECVQINTTPGPDGPSTVAGDNTNLGLIIAICVAVGAVIGIIVVLVIFVRRRSHTGLNNRTTVELQLVADKNKQPQVKVQANRPVPMKAFVRHLDNMHQQDGQMFTSAFLDLGKLTPSKTSIMQDEDSRVKIQSTKVAKQQYLDGNFIPGCTSAKDYIVCDGPISKKAANFWSVVIEERVQVIVMLTNRTDKAVSDQYLPTQLNRPQQYGDVTVVLKSQAAVNDYHCTTVTVSKGNVTHTVSHFNYTKWSDFYEKGLVAFISHVRSNKEFFPTQSPLVVHCSQGADNAGTFIATDTFLHTIMDSQSLDEDIDVFGFVVTMRHIRPEMVPNQRQFIFIHECIGQMIREKEAGIYTSLNEPTADDNVYHSLNEYMEVVDDREYEIVK